MTLACSLVRCYALSHHYQARHTDAIVSNEFLVSEAEAKLVKENNSMSKLAMIPAEFSRSSHERLALFSVSDFWDAKHAWKTIKAGVWAETSSVKMKRIQGSDSLKKIKSIPVIR